MSVFRLCFFKAAPIALSSAAESLLRRDAIIRGALPIVNTVLFLVQRSNEAPVLVPVDVASRQPDCDGYLRLIEPLELDAMTRLERVPVARCFEYDPYLAHAVQAYAAQVSTLIRVSQSVVEGLAIPVAGEHTLMSQAERVH